jgi:hypothetical protein
MGFMDKAKQAAQNAQKEGGLLDKAKQAAQQAQEKLDETQKNFNKQQSDSAAPPAGGPAVEYDKHGRPIQPAPMTPDAPPVATPGVPPTDPAEPEAGPKPDPAAPTTPATPPSAGSGLTSGDPLAG